MREMDSVQIHAVTEEEARHSAPAEDYSHLAEEFDLGEESSKASWLCFGGGARNFVYLLQDILNPDDHPFTRILGANTDVQQFREMLRPGADKPQYFPGWAKRAKDYGFRFIRLGTKGGAGRDPDHAKQKVEEKEEDIKKSFDGSAISILVANLGGGTGSGAAPEVARWLVEKRAEMGSMAVLMTPFGYEGEGAFERAEKAHKEVTAHIAALTLRNQALYELNDDPRYLRISEELKDADTGKAIAIVNKYGLAPLVYAIDQLIMYVASSVNRDPQDFKKVVQSGKALYVGSYDSEAPGAGKTPDEIVEELLNNPFLAKGIIRRAKIGMILFRGFLHSDAGYIAEKISSEMRGDEPTKNVELIPGHDAGEQGKQRIFFIAAAEEELEWSEVKKNSGGTAVKSYRPVPRVNNAEREPVNTKAAPTNSSPVETEPMAEILIGFKGPQRDIEVLRCALPLELAKQVQGFVEKYRDVPLKEREQAWEALRAAVKPYASNRQMAELQPMKFTDKNFKTKKWHITPLLRDKYKTLELRCAKQEAPVEELKREFEELSRAWEKETGDQLHIKTSTLFESAIEPPKKSGLGALFSS